MINNTVIEYLEELVFFSCSLDEEVLPVILKGFDLYSRFSGNLCLPTLTLCLPLALYLDHCKRDTSRE